MHKVRTTAGQLWQTRTPSCRSATRKQKKRSPTHSGPTLSLRPQRPQHAFLAPTEPKVQTEGTALWRPSRKLAKPLKSPLPSRPTRKKPLLLP